MERRIEITKLDRSSDGSQPLDKMSYRVCISEGDKRVVLEARISLGTLERLSEPEKRIEEWFAARSLPNPNAVIDLNFADE